MDRAQPDQPERHHLLCRCREVSIAFSRRLRSTDLTVVNNFCEDEGMNVYEHQRRPLLENHILPFRYSHQEEDRRFEIRLQKGTGDVERHQ